MPCPGQDPLLDTIVAQATPPGFGAVAVVRLSGPAALDIAARLMRREARAMASWAGRASRLRTLFRPGSGETLDRALVTVFRAPGSYTGEDVVEFSTHGGYAIPASVVAACVTLGAREAVAGEFTRRAYLNGRLDLTQAEAVADLVAARSAKGREVALHQLDRGLGDRIAGLRSRVIGLSALLVQHIDFPEEAVVEVDGFPFRLVDTAGLRGASERVERLGIEVARRYLAGADLVLYCREAGRAATVQEGRFLEELAAPVVRVRTKWDLAGPDDVPEDGEVAVSVKTGGGLDVLKRQLREHAFRGVVENRDEVPVVTRRRQADLLGRARDEVEAFREALAGGIPPEVAAAHLKSAESALEEILGVIATDDVPDRVFRDFCIGK